MNKGMVVVISAPSGCGKDTVVRALCQKRPDCHVSISATTRKKRKNEKDGIDYYFRSTEEFEKMIQEGAFLEYVCYDGNYYGTPKMEVERCVSGGLVCILVIETAGASKIMKLLPECLSIFLLPPSLEVLEKRLVGRGTDDDQTIRSRMLIANDELKHANEYDYCVVNDDLSACVDEIDGIFNKELYIRNHAKG